ncbi:uncharacterized protein Fot_24119 [Forsythia ovata]|uniref:Uncharacterized protein n=1 Tax=Forsythia ovata TaxID=205694 RepID=A0ABD1U5B3_9LAMI
MAIAAAGCIVGNSSYLRIQQIVSNQSYNFKDYKQISFPCLHKSTKVMQTWDFEEKRNFCVHGSLKPEAPLPSGQSPPFNFKDASSKIWILDMVLKGVLPYFISKCGHLLKVKVEMAEQIMDLVERVAEEVEKILKIIIKSLPEDGIFTKYMDFVENLAEKIAETAHFFKFFLDEVLKVEKQVVSDPKSLADEALESSEETNYGE